MYKNERFKFILSVFSLQGTACITDGHSLIYHSSTISCSNQQGEFCPKGILSILWRGFCPPCKNHEGDYVHPVKSFKGDYVHLVKNMKGISSTYAKMSRGDFVRGGFCPTLQYFMYRTKVNDTSTQSVSLYIDITDTLSLKAPITTIVICFVFCRLL